MIVQLQEQPRRDVRHRPPAEHRVTVNHPEVFVHHRQTAAEPELRTRLTGVRRETI
jgi:hypothetical protein